MRLALRLCPACRNDINTTHGKTSWKPLSRQWARQKDSFTLQHEQTVAEHRPANNSVHLDMIRECFSVLPLLSHCMANFWYRSSISRDTGFPVARLSVPSSSEVYLHVQVKPGCVALPPQPSLHGHSIGLNCQGKEVGVAGCRGTAPPALPSVNAAAPI